MKKTGKVGAKPPIKVPMVKNSQFAIKSTDQDSKMKQMKSKKK